MPSRPTAVVTGASRGIGRAVALRLAPEYDLIAAARTRAELDTLALEIEGSGGRCTPVVVDVGDGAAVEKAFRGMQADVVVNNAGVGIMKPFIELTPEEWRTMVSVNFDALYHVTRAFLGGMMERGRGDVVIIGSITGRTPMVNGVCYSATKHAVQGFAESLMLEVRDRGVRVSVVNPGSVATDFSGGSGQKSWALRPEDVAESVAHLLAAPRHVLVRTVEVRASMPKKPG